MPVNLGGPNAYNIGKDVVLSIIGPNGVVAAATITQFRANQRTKEIESVPLNQPPIYADIPNGWDLTFMYDRGSSVLDDLFAQMEETYWTGGQIFQFSVTETITETNGALSQYRFDGLSMKLSNGGDWKGDNKTEQEISGKASRRRKVF